MHDLDVTIVAVATPPGRGGVGCLRLSGPEAHPIALGMFAAAGKVGPDPRLATFGRLLGRGGEPVDHGYLVLFEEGASFTGESTAELWPHGSPAVLAELVDCAVEHGAAPAGPGEFTYRALRNGRLDLVRAEAVRDLVQARTLYQAKVAFAQAEGALSRRLAPLREGLEELIARGEAAVEFVEEAETHLPAGALARAIARAREICTALLAGYEAGRVVREGASLVMTGLPNAGKSSLFNRLLVRDRAIVTEVPGTTRDTIEEALDLDGIPVRLVDTAGLRDVADAVESEGVRRARQAWNEADVVVLVLDGSREPDPEETAAIARVSADARERHRTVMVLNKCDLAEAAERPLPHRSAVRISAKTGLGCDELRIALRERLVGPAGAFEDPILTDARHAEALRRAEAALAKAEATAASGLTEEIVLEDLREAIRQVGTVTGEFTADDLYDRVFSTFCIGK
jgi:tRNA modification GTPase